MERGPIFTGISVPHLSPQQISHFEIAVPPVGEQRRIVEFLASATAEVNETRAKVSREIELLREFRTRLTADVVTGQVDIRAAAARLPELDLSDLVSDVGEQDEDDLDVEPAEVDA
jgi:type I restriction enzyme S subunit